MTPYCDVGLVQFPTEGTYRYMSTKNNAFSNRRHKGARVFCYVLSFFHASCAGPVRFNDSTGWDPSQSFLSALFPPPFILTTTTGSIVVSTEDPLAFLNQASRRDGDCGSLSHGAWIGLTVGLGVLCLVLLVVAIVACVCAAIRRTTSKEYGPQSDL